MSKLHRRTMSGRLAWYEEMDEGRDWCPPHIQKFLFTKWYQYKQLGTLKWGNSQGEGRKSSNASFCQIQRIGLCPSVHSLLLDVEQWHCEYFYLLGHRTFQEQWHCMYFDLLCHSAFQHLYDLLLLPSEEECPAQSLCTLGHSTAQELGTSQHLYDHSVLPSEEES